MEKMTVKAIIPATAEKIYNVWLEGRKHGEMTGSKATGYAKVGKAFTAWDGYISGKNIELVNDKRIVQAWRSTEFAENAPDSKLEVILKKVKGGTEVTLNHSEIPEGQAAGYKKGWIDFYFKPMTKYFVEKAKSR